MRALVIVVPCAACFTTPPAPPCAAGDWSAPVKLEGIESMFDEDGPWLSADRKHVVFVSNREGTIRVYEASRADPTGPFDAPVARPELLVDVGDRNDDPEPLLSEDLLQIWLSPATMVNVDRDLRSATRSRPDTAFTMPTAAEFDTHMPNDDMGPNNSNDDADPSFSHDHMTLYFASDRINGQFRFQLFVATASSPGLNWSDAVRIDSLATSATDRAPSISDDGKTLLFESNRLGGRMVYESDYLGPGLTDFSPAVPFMPIAADGFPAGAPYQLPDGSAVVYSSDRDDGNGRDLYLIERCD